MKVWLLVLALMLSGCSWQNKVEVKKDIFHFEYGENITKDVNHYLKGDSEILQKSEIDFDSLNKKVDKFGNIKAGHYSLNVTTNGEKDTINLVISDTKKPVLKKQKSYQIEQGSSQKQLLQSIEAYDQVGDLKIPLTPKILDENNLDLDKVGKYNVKIAVKDLNGNQIKKEVEVEVIKKHRRLVCRQKQDEGNLTVQYEYNVKNNRLQSETIVMNVGKDNAMYYYLSTNKEMRKEFEQSFIDYLEIKNNPSLHFNYQQANDKIIISVTLDQQALSDIYQVDMRKVDYNKMKKQIQKIDGYVCKEVK